MFYQYLENILYYIFICYLLLLLNLTIFRIKKIYQHQIFFFLSVISFFVHKGLIRLCSFQTIEKYPFINLSFYQSINLSSSFIKKSINSEKRIMIIYLNTYTFIHIYHPLRKFLLKKLN